MPRYTGWIYIFSHNTCKNISHIRFGRVEKRFQEQKILDIIDLIDKKTNTKTDFDTIKNIVHGADEEDLAFSGLEDSMRNAFIEIYNAKKHIKRSFRESAYYVSLKKIRNFYTVEGFPKR